MEFEESYKTELLHNASLETLKKIVVTKLKVMILYSSHGTEHNNSIVLRDYPTYELSTIPQEIK